MLETLGNIGDFLGGAGVVVTLLHPASQIRQNAMAIRMSVFLDARRDVTAKRDGPSADPEWIRIYFDGNRDFESFSKVDRRRDGAFMAGLFRRYAPILYQTRPGSIDSSQ
ncbi:hypothetical protein MYXO_02362 [Myxococcaceae bacterium]|jgi:hypothetical protein|nr:hypothetical protein MYXO_02362 [Myxococcaceae bacterium]